MAWAFQRNQQGGAMRSVTLKSHVGEDGVLHLQVPVGVKNATVEVVVVFQTTTPAEATDERGWPVGFFEETAGSIPDFPLDADEGFGSVEKDVVAYHAKHANEDLE
jgi:hypothetical protein